VIDGSHAGCLDADLPTAVRRALTIEPEVCRRHAETFSWESSARQFLDNLHVFGSGRGRA
jgi:hypothetical protein